MDTVIDLESGKSFKLISISAREVRLQHHSLSDVEEILNDEGYIIGLKIDEYEVKLNGILNIKIFDRHLRPFKPIVIKNGMRENSYTLFSTTLTKASRWVMPMLRLVNETRTSMKFNSHFINCYVGTEEEGYMNEIYLVYRFSGDIIYKGFEESLKQHDMFDRMIDLDHQHVMYIFTIPEKYKSTYELFKSGRYSKFNKSYKTKILNFNINPAVVSDSDIETTIEYGVLYKTKKQRVRIEKLVNEKLTSIEEVYSSPDEIDELYTGDLELPKDVMQPEEY